MYHNIIVLTLLLVKSLHCKILEECNSICKEFSRNDPINSPNFTAEDIANTLESGECKSLPIRALGASPIGSTMVLGYKECIAMPPLSGIQMEGTMCIYMQGWVYPIDMTQISNIPTVILQNSDNIIDGDMYLHYSLVFDSEGIPSSNSLCSDSPLQAGLSSFSNLDDSSRTPIMAFENFDRVDSSGLQDNIGVNVSLDLSAF